MIRVFGESFCGKGKSESEQRQKKIEIEQFAQFVLEIHVMSHSSRSLC